MEQRIQFVIEVLDGTYTMSELCRAYSISRKTGYKWLDRYTQGGLAALHDRSRAPHSHPQEISVTVKQAILAIKTRFPRWGAAKIRVGLARQHPDWPHHPAVSTIGLFLSRRGLTQPRRRRRKATPTDLPLSSGRAINQVWCADYKGHFKTTDKHRCNPLTVTDYASRYLLCCRHVPRMDYEWARTWFEYTFREYGLPEVIRTDNGAPFSSVGLGGLSYWWIRLGIWPERIEPGHPEQNGRHERMHKTLKAHTASPPAKTLTAQQEQFNAFRKEYNEERPHEALQMRTPAALYQRSVREYPSRLPEITYPDAMRIRKVKSSGEIKLFNKFLYVAQSLSGQPVGIEQTDEDSSRLWYCNYLLGRIDHCKWQAIPIKPTRKIGPGTWANDGPKPEKLLPMSSV
jgi:transposase InsO family protein